MRKIGPARKRHVPGNRGGKGPLDFPRAMTIQVTGKTLDVREALRSYVQEHVVHTVERFFELPPAGHVRIEKEHGEFRTNCTKARKRH